MAEISIRERLPDWLATAEVVEIPEVQSAVISNTIVPGIGALVITESGLVSLGPYLETPDLLYKFLMDSAAQGRFYRGMGNFRETESGLLLKIDAAREPIETVLTHQLIDARVPRETDEYIYDPVRYHMGVMLPNLDMILLDKVEALPIIDQSQHRMVLSGWRRLGAEAATQGIRIIGTMSDVLHRGTVGKNGILKPKIAIVDQVIPGIHSRLAKK